MRYLFMEPRGNFGGSGRQQIAACVLYTLSSVIIIILGEIARRSRAAAERSRNEAAARIRELETLLDVLPIAVWRGDAKCERITGNPAAYEMLGLVAGTNASLTATKDRLNGVKVYADGRELSPDELPMQRAAMTGLGVRDFENDIVFDDGRRVTLLCNVAPVRDADGRVQGVLGAYADITARKRAEEALRESQAQFDLITRVMPAPITRCTRDLKYLWVNKAYSDWLGRRPDEIIGKPIVEIIGGPAFERLRLYFDQVLSGKTIHYEEQVEFRGLGLRWVDATYTPTFDADGVADGWVAVVLDVDDRRRAEDAVRQADRNKTEFLAILAHELRNPLMPIRTAVELLRQKGPAEPELIELRDVIDRQVVQVARLLDDLMDVGRITSGKLGLRKEDVRLKDVLDNAIESVRPLIAAERHELHVALPAEPIYLHGDPGRLAQVFANLLNNAAKYTDWGGHIFLAADREGSDVVVHVRDNGIGISADKLPNIFGMFVQCDSSLERTRGGLGIGLTLVQRLVELHEGRVEARSDGDGKGSEFIVRLPVAVAPTRGAEPEGAAEVSAVAACRILLADDNADSLALLAKFLSEQGHQIRTAQDGMEAVEAASAFRPDFALLDIGMPKLNGYEAAGRIRSALGEKPCLVAMTGWGQDDDRRRAMEAGFDHHLTKPIGPSEILKLVAAWQQRNRIPSPGTSASTA